MKSRERQLEYIRNREWRHLEWAKEAEKELGSRVEAIYSNLIRNVEKEANNWYLKYANANGISVAEAKKIANTADIYALQQKAKHYVSLHWLKGDKDTPFSEKANKEMAKYNFAMRVSRHKLLQKNIEVAFVESYSEIDRILLNGLTNISSEELIRQAGLLGESVSNPKTIARNAEVIARSSFHGETFSERLWKQQEALQQYLNLGINQSIIMGKNPKAWMNTLSQCLKDSEKYGRFALERLAVTETARVQIEAQKASYEAYGYDEYIIICEPTACKNCMPFDEKVKKTADMVIGDNAPPFHPNCRCSTSAYMSRLEIEHELAEYEKELSDKERFNRIHESVLKNQEELRKSNIPDSMKMYQFDLTPEQFRQMIQNGEQLLTIRQNKQAEHLSSYKRQKDGKWIRQWKKVSQERMNAGKEPNSILYSKTNLEQLILDYAGKGSIISLKGYVVEYHTASDYIGRYYDRGTGIYQRTKRFAIHYSKKGTHVYPVKDINK